MCTIMFWYLEKLSEGAITVYYKWVYKNKCDSRGNFKIRFMTSDLRRWILDSLYKLSKHWDEGGAMKIITLTCDEIIMKMTFCFPIEMSDYNQNFMSSVYNEKYLDEAPCNRV
jgi:hypothetical protein